jgi:hypothetical protein
MLRITVELMPSSGNELQRLGTALIANDGTGTQEVGNYTVRLFNEKQGQWKHGEYLAFPRQELNMWYLLHCCLGAALAEEEA